MITLIKSIDRSQFISFRCKSVSHSKQFSITRRFICTFPFRFLDSFIYPYAKVPAFSFPFETSPFPRTRSGGRARRYGVTFLRLSVRQQTVLKWSGQSITPSFRSAMHSKSCHSSRKLSWFYDLIVEVHLMPAAQVSETRTKKKRSGGTIDFNCAPAIFKSEKSFEFAFEKGFSSR